MTAIQPCDGANYESVSEFIEAANTVLVMKSNRDIVEHYRDARRGDWYGVKGCETGKDIQSLIMRGWSEGRDRVDAFLAKLSSIELAPRDMRRRLVRTDFGDHLDISAVYAGRFQTAWSVARRQAGQGPKRVDIVANMLCAGGDSAETLFWRGAAAVALCDKLESAGYMVRLIVGFGSSQDKVSCRIVVKRHDMPMDLATASSVIVPGFFRSIGHQWIAAHDPDRASMSGIHVGTCKMEPGEIYLSHEIKNETTARTRVEALIKQVDAGEIGEAA
jgi:hypothetical protein